MIEGQLTVQLRDPKGEPLRLAGVHLDIRFYNAGRFRYSFSLGRTDADGICRTTLEEVQRQLQANQRLFLMDYNTPLSDCDTMIGIVAPTARELSEREAARSKYWPEEPQMDAGANDRVHSLEQKFELRRRSANAFDLVCEVEGSD